MPDEELPAGTRKRTRGAETQIPNGPDYSGRLYYFFLESFEESNDEENSYTVTFEFTPASDMYTFVSSRAPQFQIFDTQTSIFTWQGLTKEQLIDTLDPKPLINWESNYREGSWYLADAEVTLNVDGNEQNHMVHIDSFVNDPNTEVYNVKVNRLRLLAYPGTFGLVPSGSIVYYAFPSGGFPIDMPVAIPAKFGFDVYDAYYTDRFIAFGFRSTGKKPTKRRKNLTDAITAAGDITSIGIMDLGIAGCNLLIAGDTPVCYYDAGSPLPAFNKTFPDAFTGPIDGFDIILSHWDWDHWSLVLRYPSLKNVTWHVNSRSPLSGKAAAFKTAQKKANKLLEYTTAKTNFIKNIDLYLCSTSRTSGGFAKNNTGLAIVVKDLEMSGKLGHVIMTGDANFKSASLPVDLKVIGVTAVHHGSKNDGADKDLPKPGAIDKTTKVQEAFEGRIAYSYGMSNAGANVAWKRPYGFPAQVAIDAYRNDKWGKNPPSVNEVSTAEGALLNTTPKPTTANEQPPNRGNIRMADQTALNVKYNASSFYPIKHKLQ